MEIGFIRNTQTNNGANTPVLPTAVRFWEPRRLVYNAILTVIVLLWLILTWPHFRSALTLGSLEAFAVLALVANLCYSAAYLADIFMQLTLPSAYWRRFRQALFVSGTLFAILLENYWIADEIYPYASEAPPGWFVGSTTMPAFTFASNMNFPAPVAVLGFLAACGGLFLALASGFIFWFARKPKFARVTGADC